ncbi:MAG: hypothetical protein R3D83_06400 [Caenibius sp.]
MPSRRASARAARPVRCSGAGRLPSGRIGARSSRRSDDPRPFAGIGAEEELRFAGTEPFWGGSVKGATLTFTTPENAEGTAITVTRFAGRGGLSFSGRLDGQGFDMMVTEGNCSDGMSGRAYPFAVTLRIGAEQRGGCAWSAQHPFTGPSQP